MKELVPITYKWNEEEISLTPEDVRKYISTDEKVTDKEVFMFMKLCQAQKLNPFVREAYLIKYGSSPANMVTGKETFLKRAEASKDFDGYEITDEGKVPEYSVTCKVYRKNLTHPITVTVDYKEYVGTNIKGEINRMWKNKPKTMLRKVALMQALREAFPIALGGLYEETELDQRAEAKIIEAEPTQKVKTTYVGNRVNEESEKKEKGFYRPKITKVDEQEKKDLATIEKLGETEVKDEPMLSEEEAQKEQDKLLKKENPEDKTPAKPGRNQLNIRWHVLKKKLDEINFFGDDDSYRDWLKFSFKVKSSKELSDEKMSEGIELMAKIFNKQGKEK